MYSEAEAIRVRDCLHGKWIHGSRIRVNFAERDSRNQYWRRKRSDYKSTSTPQSAKGRSASRAGGMDGLSAEHRVLRRVEGSVSEDSMAVLQRCSIGCCRNPISNSSLAEELRMEKVLGVHVMRLAGPRVLLIFDSIEVRQQMMDSGVLDRWFSLVVDWSAEGSALECRRAWISVFCVPVHAWSRDTFERLVSHWGSVILLEEATAEPSSFERGRVLVESSVLERIEERLELVVEGQVFPIRLTKSDTLLRGPRVYGSSESRSSSEDVASRDDEDLCPNELEEGQVIATGGPVVGIEEMATDEAKATAVVSKDLLIVPSDEPEVEGVRWRGNDLWNGQEEASNAMVQTEDAEQLVDVAVICDGPGFEGSNAEVKLVNNNSRKVGASSVACVFCGIGCDEIQHILYDCSLARDVWDGFSVGGVLHACVLNCWWWLVGCAAVLWTLWLARNEVIFRGKSLELVELCFLVKLRSFFWVKADALDCFFDEAQWWCCPLDCSFPVAAGAGGCGGVLRDGDGHIIALFSGPLGILDSNVAEIRAIAAALDILVEGKWEGLSSFVIESDSAVALSWILHKERRPWRLDRWFRDIDGACLMLPCVCFNHVLREANALADVLAKGGVDRSDWLFLCA
ncbi:hypothetical protein GQ457_05G036100 [Hibiscus cannabinus]